MNASNTKLMLKYALAANDSVLINGKHGIGKTSVVKQFAAEEGMHLETLLLSLKDPSDLLGMPNVDDIGTSKRTIWVEPDWFQKIVDVAWPLQFLWEDLEFSDTDFKKFCETQFELDDIIYRSSFNDVYCKYYNTNRRELQLTKEQYNVSCKKSRTSVIFLDELNRAELSTRQCSLQLILEKELHSHKLPFVRGQRTFIVAAINPSDDYQTEELDAALLDRFLFIDMTLDVSDWLEYANNNLVDVICSFISENPDKLHYMPLDNSKGSSPRSWEQLSEYFKTSEITNNIVLEGIISGKLGKEVGSEFYVYYKNYSNIFKVEDIIESVYKSESKNILDLSIIIKEQIKNIETIRKHNLCTQLLELASEELITEKYNILTLSLLSFLSSLNFEISIMICKKLKNENTDLYQKLVQADEKLNSKKFFADLIKYSR